ncbi:Inosine-5-monophosphate dehydrogenase, partial [Globisporangium polare]
QETLVRDIMSSHIMCVPPTTTVIDALATMTREDIRHLAAINGELSNTVKIGSVPEKRCVLSIKDIVKAYSEFEAEKKQALLEQLHSRPWRVRTSALSCLWTRISACWASSRSVTTSQRSCTTRKTRRRSYRVTSRDPIRFQSDQR